MSAQDMWYAKELIMSCNEDEWGHIGGKLTCVYILWVGCRKVRAPTPTPLALSMLESR